jgi:hypothetical protein
MGADDVQISTDYLKPYLLQGVGRSGRVAGWADATHPDIGYERAQVEGDGQSVDYLSTAATDYLSFKLGAFPGDALAAAAFVLVTTLKQAGMGFLTNLSARILTKDKIIAAADNVGTHQLVSADLPTEFCRQTIAFDWVNPGASQSDLQNAYVEYTWDQTLTGGILSLDYVAAGVVYGEPCLSGTSLLYQADAIPPPAWAGAGWYPWGLSRVESGKVVVAGETEISFWDTVQPELWPAQFGAGEGGYAQFSLADLGYGSYFTNYRPNVTHLGEGGRPNPTIYGPSGIGAVQYFTVPLGVTELTVKCWGGMGGGGQGGGGGFVQATFAVTPGQQFEVRVPVDQSGSDDWPGGWPNGGDGGAYNYNRGGGGGGSADVRPLGAAITAALVVAAGGGGQSEGGGRGGGGGLFAGGNGWDTAMTGFSQGATPGVGGAGGTGGGGAGGYGALDLGGEGQDCGGFFSYNGGGGGGGVYGGEGGRCAAKTTCVAGAGGVGLVDPAGYGIEYIDDFWFDAAGGGRVEFSWPAVPVTPRIGAILNLGLSPTRYSCEVFDVTDALNPFHVGSYTFSPVNGQNYWTPHPRMLNERGIGNHDGIMLTNRDPSYRATSDNGAGFQVWDASNLPTQLNLLAFVCEGPVLATPGWEDSLDASAEYNKWWPVAGNWVVFGVTFDVPSADYGFVLGDLSDPVNPIALGAWHSPLGGPAIRDAWRIGDYLFLTGKVVSDPVLYVFDVSAPSTPTLVTTLSSSDADMLNFDLLWGYGNFLLVSTWAASETTPGGGRVATIDVTDPANPTVVDVAWPGSSGVRPFTAPSGWYMDGDRVIAVSDAFGPSPYQRIFALDVEMGCEAPTGGATFTEIMTHNPVWYFPMDDGSAPIEDVQSWRSPTENGTPSYQNVAINAGSPWSIGLSGTSHYEGTDGGVGGTNPEWSVGAWVKTSGTAAATIVQQRDSTASGYLGQWGINMNANGTVNVFGYNTAAQYEFNITSIGTINDGSGHLVGFTVNRTANTATLYIDGSQDGLDVVLIPGSIYTSTINLGIGRDIRDNNKNWNGDISDVFLAGVLTSTDWSDLHTAGQ